MESAPTSPDLTELDREFPVSTSARWCWAMDCIVRYPSLGIGYAYELAQVAAPGNQPRGHT